MNQHPNRFRSLASKIPGKVIGSVAKIDCEVQDSFLCFLVNCRVILKCATNRCGRNFKLICDIVDCYLFATGHQVIRLIKTTELYNRLQSTADQNMLIVINYTSVPTQVYADKLSLRLNVNGEF